MKYDKIYCEPLSIEKQHLFDIRHVCYDIDEAYSCFLHFHEVHELIIFDQIEGDYIDSHGSRELCENDIVFTPALETHNYELTSRAKSWYIIQFLPETLELDQFKGIKALFNQSMHLRLDMENSKIVRQQVAWLMTLFARQPNSVTTSTLLNLILLWIADNKDKQVQNSNVQSMVKAQGFQKLEPVINVFRYDKFVNLSIADAAKKCHMSVSHFSRVFKLVFRCTFSAYMLQHKLHYAARLLGQSELNVTQISYDLSFSSPSHFIAQFKREYAITPHQYRHQLFSQQQ